MVDHEETFLLDFFRHLDDVYGVSPTGFLLGIIVAVSMLLTSLAFLGDKKDSDGRKKRLFGYESDPKAPIPPMTVTRVGVKVLGKIGS